MTNGYPRVPLRTPLQYLHQPVRQPIEFRLAIHRDGVGEPTLGQFASTTNLDDWTTPLSLGGGFAWRVSSGRGPVALGAAAQYVYNGSVVYLNEGGLVDNPDGSATLYPIRSNANYVVIRLGLTVGL